MTRLDTITNSTDVHSDINRSGTYAARPAASAALNGVRYFATDKQMEWLCVGGAWVLVGVYAPAVSGSLPGSPIQDQECVFFPDPATDGIGWHLKYDATALKYPWRFIGGPSISQFVSGTQAQTGNAGYQYKAGPSLVVPLPGEYELGLAFEGNSNAGQQIVMSYALGDVPGGTNHRAPPDDQERNIMLLGVNATEDGRATKWSVVDIPTGGWTISAMFRTIGAAGGNIIQRSMLLRPLHVG